VTVRPRSSNRYWSQLIEKNVLWFSAGTITVGIVVMLLSGSLS
jgi:hypothetical protein